MLAGKRMALPMMPGAAKFFIVEGCGDMAVPLPAQLGLLQAQVQCGSLDSAAEREHSCSLKNVVRETLVGDRAQRKGSQGWKDPRRRLGFTVLGCCKEAVGRNRGCGHPQRRCRRGSVCHSLWRSYFLRWKKGIVLETPGGSQKQGEVTFLGEEMIA